MDYYVLIFKRSEKYEVKIFKNETAYFSFLNGIKSELKSSLASIGNVLIIPFSKSYEFDEVVSVCEAFARGKINKRELEDELKMFKF